MEDWRASWSRCMRRSSYRRTGRGARCHKNYQAKKRSCETQQSELREHACTGELASQQNQESSNTISSALVPKFTVCPDGWFFLVMELFSQGSLYDVLQRVEEPLPFSLVFAIGWRLVKCLQALHQAGWLHLDIKPSNVMITDDRRRGIALIDFGLALPIQFTKISPRQAVNGTHAFVGSHVWELERESPRDDLEAIGLTMAWMLLGGKLPWTDDNPATMQTKIQDPKLPQQLSELCCHALIRDFLLQVRKLQVDDVPEYDNLLSLLEMNSGRYLENLDWPESKSSNTSPPRISAEDISQKTKRARGASGTKNCKKTKV